jgi:O-succinylbenzoic acid--CoA ligase
MDLLSAAARDAPRAPALVVGARAIDHAELAERAARCAGALAARGLRPGDRVAVTATATEEAVVAIHAVWHLGATLVPLHPRLTAVERAGLVADAGARELPADLGGATPIAPRAPDPLAIVFTSGTTGRPKAAVLSAAAFAAAVHASAARFPVRVDDRWLLALAPAHVGGLAILLRCLAARAAVAIDAPATLASLVPTQLHRLLAAGWTPPPGLRAILLGGAPAPPSLAARAPVVTTYGLTEACGTVALDGVPLPGVGVRISAAGTIQLAGPTLMSGYLHHPAPVCADGWLDTGDLGALDGDGRLQVFARRTDLILSGGENVYPAEVEVALAELPGVAAACVFGVPDPEWGQVVCAAFVGDAADGALRAHLRDRLAPFKRPRRIARLAALPIGASGKIDRAAVAAAARDLLRPL